MDIKKYNRAKEILIKNNFKLILLSGENKIEYNNLEIDECTYRNIYLEYINDIIDCFEYDFLNKNDVDLYSTKMNFCKILKHILRINNQVILNKFYKLMVKILDFNLFYEWYLKDNESTRNSEHTSYGFIEYFIFCSNFENPRWTYGINFSEDYLHVDEFYGLIPVSYLTKNYDLMHFAANMCVYLIDKINGSTNLVNNFENRKVNNLIVALFSFANRYNIETLMGKMTKCSGYKGFIINQSDNKSIIHFVGNKAFSKNDLLNRSFSTLEALKSGNLPSSEDVLEAFSNVIDALDNTECSINYISYCLFYILNSNIFSDKDCPLSKYIYNFMFYDKKYSYVSGGKEYFGYIYYNYFLNNINFDDFMMSYVIKYLIYAGYYDDGVIKKMKKLFSEINYSKAIKMIDDAIYLSNKYIKYSNNNFLDILNNKNRDLEDDEKYGYDYIVNILISKPK